MLASGPGFILLLTQLNFQHMKWLTDFVHLPMLWDVIIPVSAVILVAMVMTLESLLPVDTNIFGMHKRTHKHA